MGMDVYGNNAIEEVGKYFRRNVWGWRPLWDYCYDNFEVARQVVNGWTNDGDGLNARNSQRLAGLLKAAIEDGSAQKYIDDRNARLASLERLDCDICNGSGIRTDEVGKQMGMPERELPPEMASLTGRTHGFCNACSGEGKKDAWETNYYLDLDDIKEFAEFLEHCNGFEIC